MAITCKSGGTPHSHQTVAEVRNCYGLAQDRAMKAQFAQREAEQERAAFASDPDYRAYQTRATSGNRISAGDYPVDPHSQQFGTSLDRPTDKQVKYVTDLLRMAKLALINDIEPANTTKRFCSELITGLKAYLNRTGPKPRGTCHVGEPTARPTEPYPDVPAGRYATRSATGNNDLDFWRVDRPTEGRWAGRTFVKRVIGGKPDVNVRGATARQALEAITAMGIAESRTLFGVELGQCWKCGRHLTDELSRSLGIGPDCRSK